MKNNDPIWPTLVTGVIGITVLIILAYILLSQDVWNIFLEVIGEMGKAWRGES